MCISLFGITASTKDDQMTMPEPPITTERWLEIIKPVLEEFSDREEQERSWFNPASNGPVSSATELICTLLDTYGFEAGSQAPYLKISNSQRAACARFAQMVRAYAHARKGQFDDSAVFNDPEWERIRMAAAELMKQLFPSRSPY